MQEGLKTDYEYNEFWKEKELKFNSKFILQSYAVYLGDLEDIKPPLSGLLYLMTDGFHFEDFPRRTILFKNKKFQKTEIDIKNEQIVKITNKKNEKPNKNTKNIFDKLSSIFIKSDNFIIICYVDSNGNQQKAMFETLIKNYVWDEKFFENLAISNEHNP
jgi:hypothetical protein